MNEPRDTAGTQALDRALDLLEALGTRPDGCSVLELAELTGIPRPTVHRMLAAFARRGYVRMGPEPGQYRLGFKMIELGTGVLSSLQLRQEAQAHLRRLGEATGETIHLTVLEEGEIIYIDKVEPAAANIRMASRIGGRMPVHCTASGKAIMSLMPEREVRRILEAHGMPRRTPNTITDPDRLLAQLHEIRGHGVAYDRVENEEGVICLAAAIRGHDGAPQGAVSLSGPAFRMTENRLAELRLLMIDTVSRISAAMGWSGGVHHAT